MTQMTVVAKAVGADVICYGDQLYHGSIGAYRDSVVYVLDSVRSINL